jgi:hypothetical protein
LHYSLLLVVVQQLLLHRLLLQLVVVVLQLLRQPLLAPQCQLPPGCRSCTLHAHHGAAERLCRVLRRLAPWY